MKKRGAGIIISILIISVFAAQSAQSVSAGFFDEFFNQITGSSVEEGATETATQPPEPAPTQAPEPSPSPTPATVSPVQTETTAERERESAPTPTTVQQTPASDPAIAAPLESPETSKQSQETSAVQDRQITTSSAEQPQIEPPQVPQQPVPQKQERQCDTFVDGAGCTVTNCKDGFHEQICPERNKPQEGCYSGSERVPCPNQPNSGYQRNQAIGENARNTQTDGKCYSGEKEVPCPEGKQPSPYGGWTEKPEGPIVSSDGCPVFNMMPGPEREACEAKGGFVSQKREGSGCMSPPICIFAQESFGQGETKEQCRRSVDQMGIMRVECQGDKFRADKMQCPPDSEEKKQRIKKECSERGGNVAERTDNLGCSFFECGFPEERQTFLEKQACPAKEETDRIAEKCRSMGMGVIMVKDMGCIIARCSESNEEARQRTDVKVCAEDDIVFRQKLKDDCLARNGEPFQSFDNNGCAITVCSSEGQQRTFEEKYCKEKPPIEAYKRCEQDGGEFVVKTNDKGCVDYIKCVMRGDERKINYDDLEVDEMPSTARLLSVAMKLEELKITLDRLSRRTSSIADYYESVNDYGSSGRFRKASGMFDSAKSKVDEIKTKLGSSAKDIKEEDIIEIKHDIKYINEVILQDILYVMLSTDGEVQTSTSSASKPAEKKKTAEKEEGNNCYSDGMCFDKHLRLCDEGTIFMPGKDTKVLIKGIKNKNCVMKVETDTPAGVVGMACDYPDYAFGMKSAEDLLPYCKGAMATMIGGVAKAEKAESVEKVPKEDSGVSKEDDVYSDNAIEDSGNEDSKNKVQYTQEPTQGSDASLTSSQEEQEERIGIEFGRLGCNAPGSLDKLRIECKSRRQFACEIDVPGCEPWVVCESSPSSCPPKNYCETNPEACPDKK